MHGDLHYENVLAGEREPWLVIDPKPMSGDPHYEPAPMLWNRMEELAGDVRGGLRRRFHTIVDARRARRGPGPRLGGGPDGASTPTGRSRTPSGSTGRCRPRSGTGSPAASRSPRPSRTSGASDQSDNNSSTVGPVGGCGLSATLVSVNVGRPQVRDWAGIGRTSIEKHPVSGPVRGPHPRPGGRPGLRRRAPRGRRPGRLRLRPRGPRPLGRAAGDADPGRPVRREPHDPGIDVNEAEVGERWRIGTRRARGRLRPDPCNDFKNWMGAQRLRRHRLGEAIRGRGSAGSLPPRRRGGRRRGRRRDRGRAPAGARRHGQHDVRRAHHAARAAARPAAGRRAGRPRRANGPRSTSREPERARTVPPPGRSATGA